MDPQEITEALEHPGARNLLESATLLRLAYQGSDSFPRVIPIGFYWNGDLVRNTSRQAHVSMLLIGRNSRGIGLGSTLLRHGLERAGGLQLDIRTRTEGYYERFGASRSLGFRLRREDLGLVGADTQ